MLGNFSCVLLTADFFQNHLFKKFFQEYHQSVKQFGSRSGPTFVGPDLSPNCLQRLSAEDTCKQRVKVCVFFGKVNCKERHLYPYKGYKR